MERNSSNDTTLLLDYPDWIEKKARAERYIFILCAYVGGPLILAGLIGNIIAICTLRKLMSQNMTIFLLRGLAVVDISVLLGNAVFFCYLCADPWFSAITISTPYFKLNVSSVYDVFITVNIWTTVMVGMNRYIALCRPLDATRLCTTSRTRKHMICIVLVSIVFELPGFFHTKSFNRWHFYIYEFGCNVMFRFLIPFGMLLFFTARIIITLRASRRKQLGRHGGHQVDRKLTSMLLVLLGVFLVCHVYIWGVAIALLLHDLGHAECDFIILLCAFITAHILYVLNSSVNCLIYIVYLKEFRRLLCKKRTDRAQQNQDYELS